MSEPQKLYESRVAEYDRKISFIKKRMLLVSMLRLLSVVLLLIMGYRLIGNYTAFHVAATVFAGLAFIGLIRISFVLNDRKRLFEKLLFVNQNELGAAHKESNGFPDGSDISGPAMY